MSNTYRCPALVTKRVLTFFFFLFPDATHRYDFLFSGNLAVFCVKLTHSAPCWQATYGALHVLQSENRLKSFFLPKLQGATAEGLKSRMRLRSRGLPTPDLEKGTF